MAFFKRMGRKEIKGDRDRNFDRTFILFGKGSSGKSTLGNLLLGEGQFKEHQTAEAFGLTKKVHSGKCQIESSRVYDLHGAPNEMLNIQVFDQPGFSDHDFSQENLCQFLEKCIAQSKAEMTATFLILINLNSQFFSIEELLTVINLAEIMSESCYSFFSNAIIVFTHADKINEGLNEFQLEHHLHRMLEQEDYACIQKLIDLVDKRYIFINGSCKSEGNRIEILKKIFQLSKPSLNVYINGYNGFRGSEIKKMFRKSVYDRSFKNNSLKYDEEYHFNPDLNVFKKESRNLDQKISDALSKLSRITQGISAMMILISLEDVFNETIYNLILNLPKTYNLGRDVKQHFWNYACIVFKTSDFNKESVEQGIKSNPLLSALVMKVKSRYTWVTRRISQEECSKRLTELVKRVKQDSEGKTYTDRVVLTEMRSIIDGSNACKRDRRKSQIGCKIKNEDLRSEIPFYQSERGAGVTVACNNFFWDKDTISVRIGYFILKNMSQEAADQFEAKFPNEEMKISTEEYKNFCVRALENCEF